MILYISYATAYSIYDALFREGKIAGYQMQKFNSNLITGLGAIEKTVALSALPYANVPAKRFECEIDGVRYIGIRNFTGLLHKIMNPLQMYLEGCRIIRRERPRCILCDAIASSPCYVSLLLGKRFGIPVIGIVTDLPGMLDQSGDETRGAARLRHFDGYVLLTEQMNPIVNRRGKPSMVMEGLCAASLPPVFEGERKKVLLYTGSLWKKDLGIEYFTEGFLRADLQGYELHFYGTGELEPWLQEMSAKHSNIKYCGCVTNAEIVKLQREASLLINPRPSDRTFCKYSFPSKTIEYMASGTPVLMTRLPGAPEEYFDYVYTIEDETAAGTERALRGIFAQEESARHAFGLRAKAFVETEKSCMSQCGRIIAFSKELAE